MALVGMDNRKKGDPQYKSWCESVGISPDSEGGECWNYQQEIIDKLNEEIAKLHLKTTTASGEKIFRSGDLEAAAHGNYVPHLTDRYEIAFVEEFDKFVIEQTRR